MRKLNVSSIIFWFFVAFVMVLYSCNQPTDKSPIKSKLNDSSQSQRATDTTEKTIVFDSAVDISSEGITGERYLVDIEKSFIYWYCVTHSGYVKLKNGIVVLADGNILKGKFEICMDSILDVDIDYQLMKEVLENTLKSADFFDIKNYPVSYFNIVNTLNLPDDSCEVVGNLKIKDIQNQIQFKANIQNNDSIVIVNTERFAIDRTKWGLTIYSKNFEQTDDSFLFTDFVEIEIFLQLVKNTPIEDK